MTPSRFLLGVAALDEGMETQWIILAGIFGALAIGGLALALVRLGGIGQRADEPTDEVRAPDAQGVGPAAEPRRPLSVRRTQISFHDALLACHALRPKDAATARTIMDLLGLTAAPSTPAPQNIGASKPSSSSRTATERHPSSAVTDDRDVSPTSRGRPPAVGQPVVSTVRRTGNRRMIRPPEWFAETEPFSTVTGAGEPPPIRPLFARVHQRGILTAAMSTLIDEGELDIDAIVETLASGRPLRELPRATTMTTRRGAQVLLDRSRGMTPFSEDQQQLESALDHILGDEHYDVRSFVGCPSRGLLWAREPASGSAAAALEPWAPPPSGTPIIAVTDLGIGGPLIDDERATAAEWTAFADRVRATGHSLIALVPYEAARWPPRVARQMTVLHWSERTTAGQVRHAMRDAKRRLA